MFWSTRRVAFGLIGCGGMGQMHAKVIARHPLARLVCVYDPVEQRAAELARQFVGVTVARDEHEVLDSAAEALVIATPHRLHKPQTLAALRAGKHVLVEKPLALSYADSGELVQAAERVGRRLLVGQVMRFWPNVVRARAAIAAGRIGAVRHVIRRRLVCQKDAGRAWAYDRSQSGGWVLHGIACHEVDAVLYLTQSTVAEVAAVAARNNPRWDDIDELGVLLTLSDGTICSLTQSLNCTAEGIDTVVVGTAGTVVLSAGSRGFRVGSESATLGASDGLGEQLDDFIAAIRQACESRVDAKEILETMRVLDLIHARLNSTSATKPEYAHA